MLQLQPFLLDRLELLSRRSRHLLHLQIQLLASDLGLFCCLLLLSLHLKRLGRHEGLVFRGDLGGLLSGLDLSRLSLALEFLLFLLKQACLLLDLPAVLLLRNLRLLFKLYLHSLHFVPVCLNVGRLISLNLGGELG